MSNRESEAKRFREIIVHETTTLSIRVPIETHYQYKHLPSIKKNMVRRVLIEIIKKLYEEEEYTIPQGVNINIKISEILPEMGKKLENMESLLKKLTDMLESVYTHKQGKGEENLVKQFEKCKKELDECKDKINTISKRYRESILKIMKQKLTPLQIYNLCKGGVILDKELCQAIDIAQESLHEAYKFVKQEIYAYIRAKKVKTLTIDEVLQILDNLERRFSK